MELDTSQVMKLGADIERSSGRVGKKAAQVVRKSAELVKTRGQALAPVGATGDLRNSIKVQSITGDGRGSSITAEIGSTLRYAYFVEHGTLKHGGPQPFMGPALESVEGSFLQGLAEAAEAMGL